MRGASWRRSCSAARRAGRPVAYWGRPSPPGGDVPADDVRRQRDRLVRAWASDAPQGTARTAAAGRHHGRIAFCGACTTFSTFSYELVCLCEKGQVGKSLLHAVSSRATGLSAAATALPIGSL
ncbi:CrcB family protein [Streptomyces sp. NPDC020362]|uniref:FluC/FEX family fluoride channel n=1 Tax=unclassified Streptomyces TaxID=2593676 RepID=UPI00340D4A4E